MNVLNEFWTLVHIYDKRRWTMERRRIRSVAGTTRVAFTMSSTCKLRVAVCERVLFDDMMQPSRQYKSLIHNEYEWILVNHYLIVSRISHTHTHRRQCPTIQCCHLCSGICPFPHYLGNSVIMMRESQWMKATLTRSQSSKWNMVCLYVWASEAILSFVFFFDNSCSLWTSEHSRSKLLNWCFTAMIGWPWLSIYFPRDSMSIFFIYDPIGWCTEEKTY